MLKLNVPILLPVAVMNCNFCGASFSILPVTCEDGENKVAECAPVCYCPFCGKEGWGLGDGHFHDNGEQNGVRKIDLASQDAPAQTETGEACEEIKGEALIGETPSETARLYEVM